MAVCGDLHEHRRQFATAKMPIRVDWDGKIPR
jgi:hypothetical protein